MADIVCPACGQDINFSEVEYISPYDVYDEEYLIVNDCDDIMVCPHCGEEME